ncbi:MAG: hypothetical protein KBB01_00320 [Candidatus Omnitrophica bacterium]|jgi:hypothetical protein|nr:hypothetical protein [Candidatus Omnitrophota bacterium]
MGRSKKELKRIHNKKVKKSKQKVSLFVKNQLSYKDLSLYAKHFLKKSQKKKKIIA